MNILQVQTGAETLQVIGELRKVFQKKLGGGDDIRITNGYLLNKSFMENRNKLSIEEWDKIRSEKIAVTTNATKCITKFRLAEETARGIDELVKFFSDAYGMRVRKNFVVKLILKRELIKLRSEKL